MSIVESLRRLVDPVGHRHEELRRRALREEPRREEAGGPPEEDEAAERDPAVQYRCRVCGHVSEDRSYCPKCLADTMRKL